MLFEKQLNYFFSFLGFLLLNFTGLAIGALWTDPGVSSLWYDGVTKAPWTPPGWVFGFSWTLIMVCFSILFANLYSDKNSKYNQIIALTWLLNLCTSMGVDFIYCYCNTYFFNWSFDSPT